MGNNKIYEVENVLITLKAFVVSLLTIIVMSIPFGIAYVLINEANMLIVGRLIQVLSLVCYFWVWGWIANKFWDWE